MNDALVTVRNLRKYFPISNKAVVKAVDDISFCIRRGETLGLVGESGCGKTTTGRMLLRLIEPTSGEVSFEGKELLAQSKTQLRALKKKMALVFQDPCASLNPRMTIGRILTFPMEVHDLYEGKREKRVSELLEMVGMRISDANRYPHEFSGGQLQRIGIARALAVDPIFIVADEPVSALDVSIQSQVLNLFKDLQEQLHLTYLFIAHDLSVVEFISDRIAVLYLGKIVEIAHAQKLYRCPLHYYTKSLINAIPLPDPEIENGKPEHILLDGEVPSPINPPTGCRFHPRCSERIEECSVQEPPLVQVADDHFVACHRVSS